MPLTPSTLANQLQNMTPTTSELEAITRFTDAYIAFMSESVVTLVPPIPIVPIGLQGAPKTACIAAKTGLSIDGATAIQSGLIAFWGAMMPLAATLYPTATLLVPPAAFLPGATILSPLLTTVFAANVQGQLSLADCCTAIASVIYTASLGGTATVPLLVPPFTPTPTPIL